MSWEKISSDVPSNCPPIQRGDTICWHWATFQDLMTEKSKMINTSFLTGIESGIAGGYSSTNGTKWLLFEVLREKCYLGEKSIWKWSEKSRDMVCFVKIVEQNQIPIATSKKSEAALAKVDWFRDRAKDELKLLERSQAAGQLRFSDEEILEYSCVCFGDYWLDQDSALLDTTFSCCDVARIFIRRAYIQGWWALALRQLGALLRFRIENKEFWEPQRV